MSYCKIGRFKPGDIIIARSRPSSILKVIGIKRRKNLSNSMYKLQFPKEKRSNINLPGKFSREIEVIDYLYELSLSNILKKL